MVGNWNALFALSVLTKPCKQKIGKFELSFEKLLLAGWFYNDVHWNHLRGFAPFLGLSFKHSNLISMGFSLSTGVFISSLVIVMCLKPGDPCWEIFIFLLYYSFSQEAKPNLFTHNTFRYGADSECRWKVFFLLSLTSLGSAGLTYFSGVWNPLTSLILSLTGISLRANSVYTLCLLVVLFFFFSPKWLESANKWDS